VRAPTSLEIEILSFSTSHSSMSESTSTSSLSNSSVRVMDSGEDEVPHDPTSSSWVVIIVLSQ